jgi:pimeloyl-ACP methyl ester carboxylesterase
MTDTNRSSITRRGVLASATAGAAALGSTLAMSETSTQKTFVLMHGAWHGGWCWRRVSDQLEKRGHKVFAPTLTGVGERSHLLSKDVNLDTHITDIVNVVKWEDLNDICLVVHSYGGWPGSGALERIGDRVTSIVWLDAFKPEDGQRGFDFASEFSRKALLEAVEKGKPGRRGPTAATFLVNEKDRAWVDSKLTPQPNGVALQPIRLTGAREKVAKKTYIRAAKYPQPAFDKAYAECKADKTWKTFETTAAGHDVMVDAPAGGDPVAGLLSGGNDEQ